MASRSTDDATTASVAKNAAWRSRGMTCVEIGSTRQSHLMRHIVFDARINIGESADGARNRAGRNFPARLDEPLARAGEFGVGLGQFQPEGRRLGVNAVRAADRRRVFMLKSARLERGEQRVDVGDQQIRGARQLHGKTGVEHVRRRHALMHESATRRR